MKSHASDLVGLATSIYIDAIAKCTTVTVDQRDLHTLRSRVEHEGISFLTITLPKYGQDFERSLAIGRVESTTFRSFKKVGSIPAFLRGMITQVFDQSTGRIYDEPDVAIIEGIRQIAYAFKKIQLACTPERDLQAFSEFAAIERELEQFEEGLDQADIQDFIDCSRVLWPSVLPGCDYLDGTVPKHGPGATAESISGNRKYIHASWHERLEQYFPFLGDAYSISAYDDRVFQNVTFVPQDQELPVRVITVPKTLKAPRIIAIEPVCMQYAQQSLSQMIVRSLESGWLTRGHVNFTDQTINRSLALESSKTGRYATIDLSSASDRVPLSMVKHMLGWHPDLLGAILACRSTRAKLPNEDILTLRKFASMGSALCFPIEAMYFYTICVMALLRKQNLPVTSRNLYRVSRDVYVYGDDIIVPVDAVDVVTRYLQKYNCIVNSTKSFWTGKFRESCGMDAYDGEEVTPTYIRQTRPSNKRDAAHLISWVETSNLFYKKGYWLTASHMIKQCEKLLGKLPVVHGTCAGLGKVSFQDYHDTHRVSGKYQSPEIRTWVPRPVYQKDKLDGYPALQKCLTQMEARISPQPSTDERHLCHTARHGAVALQRRWVSPY